MLLTPKKVLEVGPFVPVPATLFSQSILTNVVMVVSPGSELESEPGFSGLAYYR